jgi:hypothetical protein
MPILASVALFALIALSAGAQLLTDPRLNRKFVYRSLLALLLFAGHCTIGGLVFFWLLPHPPEAVLGVMAGFSGWLGLGMLGLLRLAPRTREPPRWLLHVGIADLVCLAVIAAGIASVLGWI